MKTLFKNIDKKWKEYALAGCITVLFFVCITHLGILWSILAGFVKILSPVIIGFVLAFIINLVAEFFQGKILKNIKNESHRWKISVVLALIIVIVVLALLMMSLIPQMVASVGVFIENYPSYVIHLENFIAKFNLPESSVESIYNFLDSLSSDEGVISKLADLIANYSEVIWSKTTSIGGAALNWLIGGIFAIYFLLDKKNILAAFSKLFSLALSPTKFEKSKTLAAKFDAIFSKYIACEIIDSLIIGIVNYIVMLVLKMPNALFISFIVGVTNLAPTFGPIAGAAIGAFILLLVKPAAVIPFLILTVVLQTLDAYIIKPKLFGDALNVPGVLILIAIIVFGKLMGVLGILLAIPLVAIIVYIYKEMFIPWLQLRRDLEKYKKELE